MKTILKNKYFWIAIVVGLILGDIIGVAFFRDGENAEAEAQGSNTTVQLATTSPYFVKVSQQAAGDTVFISEARAVASSTWLAVREQNGDLLGRILGARRLDATVGSDITIDLLRPTASHVMYAVVMYEDDGDRAFDHAVDSLVQENGTPVAYPFTAF